MPLESEMKPPDGKHYSASILNKFGKKVLCDLIINYQQLTLNFMIFHDNLNKFQTDEIMRENDIIININTQTTKGTWIIHEFSLEHKKTIYYNYQSTTKIIECTITFNPEKCSWHDRN
jgi:hypothetical protein